MPAFNKFNQFVQDLANKVHNLGSDTLKVMLTNTAPVATNTVKANLTEITAGNGYTAGGNIATQVSSSQTGGTQSLICNNVIFTATGSIGPFQYAVLYNDTPTSPADPLIGWWDYGSALTLAAGNRFLVSFDGGSASGSVLTLSDKAYSAESQQFFSRLSTQPSIARKDQYAALIDSLVGAGVWAKLDALYIFAAADSVTALTNLKSASYTASAVSSPNFTVDHGFAGDGTTSYVDTGYNPSLGSQYTLNSAHISARNLTSRAAGTIAIVGAQSASFSNISWIMPFFGSGTTNNYVNTDTNLAVTSPSSDGLFVQNRSSSTAEQAYRNGASLGSTTSATSTGVPNANFWVGGASGGFFAGSTDQVAMFSAGAGLTSTDVANFYAAEHAFMQAVAGVA